MKTGLLRAGYVLALFLVTCKIAYGSGPLVAFRSDTELTVASVLLPVGTSRDALLEQLGPPDTRLSADVWVYWDRRTNQPQLTQGYDTLLVIFSKDRVQFFKIVPQAPVRQFLAEQEKRIAATSLMATAIPSK